MRAAGGRSVNGLVTASVYRADKLSIMDLPMDSSLPHSFNKGGSETDEGLESRSRDSLFLMARLRTPSIDETFSVRIRNLSPGGLMADFGIPLPRDTALEIDVRGIGWVSGKVAWFAEGRTGVAFDVAINPHKARKPVAVPTPAAVGPPSTRSKRR